MSLRVNRDRFRKEENRLLTFISFHHLQIPYYVATQCYSQHTNGHLLGGDAVRLMQIDWLKQWCATSDWGNGRTNNDGIWPLD